MATAESDQPTTANSAAPDDDLRRRYLEALERKRAGGVSCGDRSWV